MSQHVAHILDEIGQLAPQEVAELHYELSKRVDRQEQTRAILAKYRGKGAGVWPGEPQEYINTLRDADRF